MSVREAQARIDSREFAEWMAYARVEHGFGPPADYWRAALIASTVGNTAHRKKGAKPFTVEDFMPQDDTQEPKSQDQLQAEIDAAMSMFGDL